MNNKGKLLFLMRKMCCFYFLFFYKSYLISLQQRYNLMIFYLAVVIDEIFVSNEFRFKVKLSDLRNLITETVSREMKLGGINVKISRDVNVDLLRGLKFYYFKNLFVLRVVFFSLNQLLFFLKKIIRLYCPY